jgi:hypothetical protein
MFATYIQQCIFAQINKTFSDADLRIGLNKSALAKISNQQLRQYHIVDCGQCHWPTNYTVWWKATQPYHTEFKGNFFCLID